jgi:transcriptional regulator with XRE-family HTH domain
MRPIFARCEISRQAEFRDRGLTVRNALCERIGVTGPSSSLHVFLRAWRKAAGLTLEQLENKIGSKANTISGWETGNRTVDLDDLKKLADTYGVHPAALLFAPPGGQEFDRLREAAGLLQEMDGSAAAEWLAIGRRIVPKPSGA